jgi:dGTPase
MMDWKRLLSAKRLEKEHERPKSQPGRSPFQQDIDRIVFSGAFRRLAHKTQVHPLSDNDNVHTRLTHTIEVASVGRSLGTRIGSRIAKRIRLKGVSADTFGYIVQAACLAHDMGNPPFGHFGEEAIGTWFRQDGRAGAIFADAMTEAQRNDLRLFDGNAQGFRIVTQLESDRFAGGLQLTYAVLGAFVKYPCSSDVHAAARDGYVGTAKVGLFDAELPYFRRVARALGLLPRGNRPDSWCRHPLAFVVEAADDICYAIVDIEDGFELGYLTFAEARAALAPLAKGARIPPDLNERGIIGKLRAVAIGELVEATSQAFLANEKAILKGTFDGELLAETKYGRHVRVAKKLARKKIFRSDRKTRLEIAGSEVISGLLDLFHTMILDLEKVGWDVDRLDARSKRISRLVPDGLVGVGSRYAAWLRVTDYVSGMTDRYAVDLFRRLKGISI